MKKFYLCKLCLIVFGVLLAVQSAMAEDQEVWFCTTTADIFILPDGDFEDVYKTKGHMRKWKVAIKESVIVIDEGPPNGLGDFNIVRSPSQNQLVEHYAAISKYGYTLIHLYLKSGIMNVSRHDATMVNGMQFECSKF